MTPGGMYAAPLLLLALCWPAAADIDVINDSINSTVTTMEDALSMFGPGISSSGISGWLMVSQPLTACSALNVTSPPGSWILLISRGFCTFEDKVWRAQTAGFRAAIVFNVNSDAVSPMHGDGNRDIRIPSFFVGQSNGLQLTRFTNATVYHLHITGRYPFDFADYLIPFAVVIAVCFIVLVGIMVYRCYADHRRAARHRLPRRALNSLPTRRFCAASDPYDTCAICLDDYQEGDKLRILPCNHAYHAGCVDPWLTRSKRVCPVCKRRVLAAESDSETEDAPPTERERESEPLLEPRARRGYGATQPPGGARGGNNAREGTSAQQPRRPHRSSRRARRQQRLNAAVARVAPPPADAPTPVHEPSSPPVDPAVDEGTPEPHREPTSDEPRGASRGGYQRLREEPDDVAEVEQPEARVDSPEEPEVTVVSPEQPQQPPAAGTDLNV